MSGETLSISEQEEAVAHTEEAFKDHASLYHDLGIVGTYSFGKDKETNLRLGKARRRVAEQRDRLEKKLAQSQLALMEQYVLEGHVPQDIFKQHKLEFDEKYGPKLELAPIEPVPTTILESMRPFIEPDFRPTVPESGEVPSANIIREFKHGRHTVLEIEMPGGAKIITVPHTLDIVNLLFTTPSTLFGIFEKLYPSDEKFEFNEEAKTSQAINRARRDLTNSNSGWGIGILDSVKKKMKPYLLTFNGSSWEGYGDLSSYVHNQEPARKVSRTLRNTTTVDESSRLGYVKTSAKPPESPMPIVVVDRRPPSARDDDRFAVETFQEGNQRIFASTPPKSKSEGLLGQILNAEEMKVLTMMANGVGEGEMARGLTKKNLGWARAVKFLVYRKLGASADNIPEAVSIALAKGILRIDDVTDGLDLSLYSVLTDKEKELLRTLTLPENVAKNIYDLASELHASSDVLQAEIVRLYKDLGLNSRVRAVVYAHAVQKLA